MKRHNKFFIQCFDWNALLKICIFIRDEAERELPELKQSTNYSDADNILYTN